MESEILAQLKAQEEKINQIWQSVEKTRKYFLVTMWITIIVLVLPMIGLFFAIPAFMNNYVDTLNTLSGM